VYDNNCDTDCNVCGYGRTVPDHIYDNVCDESCNECGAIRGIEHLYDMECDITCNKCGGIREVPHFYDDASDSICNRCGHNRNKASGKTGDCDWYIIDDTLYITGNGAMGEYTYSSTLPWGNTFTQVVIKNGVTTVGNYAFYYCSKLTSVTIPNSVISIGAYAFQNCTSLVAAPVLPATTLVAYCYQYMFYGCSSLNSIVCLATDISGFSCTEGWVGNVASSGTFTKASLMTDWTTGTNGIPSGWTVLNQ
jgi:hypothetical protein